jgi:hypothetical protein
MVAQHLARRGPVHYSPFDEKKAGRGAQPKEDKMKKLIILNLRYQSAGET